MCRKRKIKCPEILVVIDDMADRTDVLNRRSGARNGGSHITSLAVRGRHSHISWIVSTQCLNLVCSPVRKNVRNLVIYKAKSAREIESLVEELAAVYDKETLLKLYEIAVNDQPFSFLNVKLDAPDRKDMFWLRWDARLLPERQQADLSATATNPYIEESDDEHSVGRRSLGESQLQPTVRGRENKGRGS